MGGTITITVVQKENTVIVAVKDEGSGMNQETLEQLFSTSLASVSARRVNNNSAGIGLLLSRHLIEKHHGEIWAESKEQKGASFFFSLPIQPLTMTDGKKRISYEKS